MEDLLHFYQAFSSVAKVVLNSYNFTIVSFLRTREKFSEST
jgi:hypothetical protein